MQAVSVGEGSLSNSDHSVTEYDEGGGSKSIVFQKPNDQVGFEMFITPDDADDPLTAADLKLDFPTLQMDGTQSMSIGTGTEAVALPAPSLISAPPKTCGSPTTAICLKSSPTPPSAPGSPKSSAPSASNAIRRHRPQPQPIPCRGPTKPHQRVKPSKIRDVNSHLIRFQQYPTNAQ